MLKKVEFLDRSERFCEGQIKIEIGNQITLLITLY